MAKAFLNKVQTDCHQSMREALTKKTKDSKVKALLAQDTAFETQIKSRYEKSLLVPRFIRHDSSREGCRATPFENPQTVLNQCLSCCSLKSEFSDMVPGGEFIPTKSNSNEEEDEI